MDRKGKVIILSAPSGSGKSTIIKQLMLQDDLRLGFSVSATTRTPRPGEVDKIHYYFLAEDDFRHHIDKGDFIEWEEVYGGSLYGTLKSEVERVTGGGMNLIMDIDVEGSLNVKKQFGHRALSIFIMPPGVKELERRLHGRGTDTPQVIAQRLAKAEHEMTYAPRFDVVVVNDDLDQAVAETEKLIRDFIK